MEDLLAALFLPLEGDRLPDLEVLGIEVVRERENHALARGERARLEIDLVDAGIRRDGLCGRIGNHPHCALLDRFDLLPLARKPFGQLSRGQRYKAAFASLVTVDPDLWLLDEPHAGLDAVGRDDLDATLREAVAAGATVMVASHELERAGSLATRTVDTHVSQVRKKLDLRPESGYRVVPVYNYGYRLEKSIGAG